jgi:hypothetical protein
MKKRNSVMGREAAQQVEFFWRQTNRFEILSYDPAHGSSSTAPIRMTSPRRRPSASTVEPALFDAPIQAERTIHYVVNRDPA